MDYAHGITDSSQNHNTLVEELDTDFKRKYPPGSLGRELDDGARVWKVYRDEATAYDNTMLDGWSQTLDILLIFAGLFSAVATAFVIESYQLLQPDNEAFMVSALYIIALASNSSAASQLPVPAALDTSIGSLPRWINGLWFTSILLSLAVAFLTILVKQWITEYRARNNASAKSPHHWARRRQLYFQALNAWPVAELVSILPILLHVALFLFFAGTVAFLWSFDRAISVWVVVLGLSLGTFYLGCTLLPIWIPECPTSTPLIHQLRRLVWLFRLTILRAAKSVLVALSHWMQEIQGSLNQYGFLRITPQPRTFIGPEPPNMTHRLQTAIALLNRINPNALMSARLKQWDDRLDAAALQWLMLSVSDSDAVAVGVQALAAVVPESSLFEHLRTDPRLSGITPTAALVQCSGSRSPTEMTRVTRSILVIRRATFPSSTHNSDQLLMQFLEREIHPDCAFIYSLLRRDEVEAPMRWNAESWFAASPSSTTTVLLLLRSVSGEIDIVSDILRYCRLEDIREVDWSFLEELFAGYAKLEAQISSDLASAMVSLCEMLARFVATKEAAGLWRLEYHEKEIIDLARMFLARLLPHAAATRRDLFSDHPSLLDYVVTADVLPTVFAPNTAGDILQTFPQLWKEALTDHKVYRYLRSFTHVVALFTAGGTIVYGDYHLQLSWLFCRVLHVLDDCSLKSVPWKATALVIYILHKLPGFPSPFWSLLCRMPKTGRSAWLAFVREMARVLLLLRPRFKDDDITDFLGGLYLREIIPSNDSLKDEYIHIVQFCIALSPRWWISRLNEAHSSGDKALISHIARLTHSMAGHACEECANIPLRRDEEYDDAESSSSCSFNPC
ncbi:hypothetical protein EXIGLDRAFT_707548 [Exidia glandulosa HHB12029]|uniref:DUF6535 domain-containing protein n=1 Tax=Exidia glandulosa HHB12029 TaxID=1314781 RepID=A0A165JSQ0_EXIGL|nr:hypothetical protein EXIGLDRAFT_707548 [Exidia glandulosa HHB12029]